MGFLSRILSRIKRAKMSAAGNKDEISSCNKKQPAKGSDRDDKKLFLKKERRIEKKAASERASLISDLSQRFPLNEVRPATPEDDFSRAFSGMILSDAFTCSDDPVCRDDGTDEQLLQLIRSDVGSAYLPDTVFSRGEFSFFKSRFLEHNGITKTAGFLSQMYTDWLFFCKDAGYDMDDYFDYEFYNKDLDTRYTFLSAAFRDNLRRYLNADVSILAKKGLFLKTFSDFVRRAWLDCSICTLDEFRSFCRQNPVFFCKTEKGYGGEGLQKLQPAADQIDDLYKRCRDHKSIVEAPITQHASISRFNPSTVNSIRIITIADADDQILIPNAAMRFGRKNASADNYHQGGLTVKVDTANGIITGDAIDRTGKHYAEHPDSGIRFDGFKIPCWDQLRTEVIKAAQSCMDADRFIGWDLAVTDDGYVDFIEGNSFPGFGILQAPDMTGIKNKYIIILSGLVSEEDLLSTRKGYFRKWKLNI